MAKLFALGPKGSYTHQVAQALLSEDLLQKNVHIYFCASNTEVLKRVKQERGFCVVPIENSRGGLVDEVIRFWLRQSTNPSLQVVREIHLPICHHLLMWHGGNSEQVTQIVSHPQAISQCAETIRHYWPEAIITHTSSTAVAAKQIAEDAAMDTVGVIASAFAAKIYHLKIAHQEMHDFSENLTRFHIIAPHSHSDVGESVSKISKTAVMFHLPNVPGALFSVQGRG